MRTKDNDDMYEENLAQATKRMTPERATLSKIPSKSVSVSWCRIHSRGKQHSGCHQLKEEGLTV